MEDLFSNPYSEIPDQLWKSPSSAERQLAAVRYWADLRGVEKSASAASDAAEQGSNLRRRIRKLLVHPQARNVLAGGIVGGLGVGASLLSTRKKPQSTEVEVVRGKKTKTPTAEQLDLRADRASLEERKARGDSSSIKERLQSVKENIADLRSQYRIPAAAIEGGLMAGAGVAAMKYRRRGK